MSKGERVLSMHECEEVGVCASKCMSKRTKPDWVHTSLELCKRKIRKNASLGAQRAPLFIIVKSKHEGNVNKPSDD